MKIFACTVSIALLASGTTGTPPPPPVGPIVLEQVFFVGAATSQQMLPGVRVSIIGPSKGSRSLGQSNEFGRFAVPASMKQNLTE